MRSRGRIPGDAVEAERIQFRQNDRPVLAQQGIRTREDVQLAAFHIELEERDRPPAHHGGEAHERNRRRGVVLGHQTRRVLEHESAASVRGGGIDTNRASPSRLPAAASITVMRSPKPFSSTPACKHCTARMTVRWRRRIPLIRPVCHRQREVADVGTDVDDVVTRCLSIARRNPARCARNDRGGCSGRRPCPPDRARPARRSAAV